MLFTRECKKIFRSLTFIIYCAMVILMFFTQFWPELDERVTSSTIESYELTKISGEPETIMPKALDSLTGCYFSNTYRCYPYGLLKAVHLNSRDNDKIKGYIIEISGLNDDEMEKLKAASSFSHVRIGTNELESYNVNHVPLREDITYGRFREIMGEIDDILGGGSDYRPDDLAYKFSQEPMSHAEIIEQYDDFIEKDHIAAAYGRLLSDYLGIVLAVIPVFAAAALVTADKRAKMDELVYSRRISSFRLIFTRFSALVLTMALPVLLCASITAAKIMHMYKGDAPDIAGAFTVPGIWLLPNIMLVTALGMCISELFSAGMAILVQFAAWFICMMMTSSPLYGHIGRYTFVCRHNSLFYRSEFMEHYSDFLFNRIFYTAAALAAVLLTVIVYELKRGGRFNGLVLFGKDSIFRRKA
ncbi:MAG: ABC transporter permease [Ruminococcus sp.]|nr:ABC transporter permease [Ruminococcus sp.]